MNRVVRNVPSIIQQFVRSLLVPRGGTKAMDNFAAPSLCLEHTSNNMMNRKHINRYASICGFNTSPVKFAATAGVSSLPITYPHMHVFPLQTMLMLDPLFPFPLIGMIHLSNRIQLFDTIPIDGDAPLTTIVRFDDAYIPHEKGLCVTVIAEIFDAKKRLLWREEGTMLRRCYLPSHLIAVRDFSSGTGAGISMYESSIKEAGVKGLTEVERWNIDFDMGRIYAQISGDYNPIHLTKVTAIAAGFPQGAIIHGMWAKAKVVATLIPQETSKKVVDSCKAKGDAIAECYVEFKTPLYLGSEAVLSVSEDKNSDSEANPSGHHKMVAKVFEVKGTGGDKLPHLRGTVSWAVETDSL